MEKKITIGSIIAAILFGGLFIAIGVYLLSFVQFDISESDLESRGVYSFTAVDRDHKVHEKREKKKNRKEVVVTQTHTYYLVYETEDGTYRFKEKVSEQKYEQFQQNKEQNLPQSTMERSVWCNKKTDSYRYERVNMTASELRETIQKENRTGMLMALGIIGVGVLCAIIILLPRKHPHRVKHVHQRKGRWRTRYR